MVEKKTTIELYNATLNTSGLSDRLPRATAENLKNIANKIFTGGEYRTALNEFLEALINKIGLTLFRNAEYYNEFEQFIYYGMDFGEVIEEIFTQPAKGKDYRPETIQTGDSIDPFTIEKPDVKALYIKNEIRRMYTVTTFQEQLKRAFYNDYGLYNMLDGIAKSILDGAKLDTRAMFKELLNNVITVQKPGWRLVDNPKMYEYNNNNYIQDRDTALNFVASVKNKISDLMFPSGEYNSQGAIQQLRPDDLVIFLRKDIATTLQTQLLSSAFHRDELNFMPAGFSGNIKIILVEDFGGVQAWTADGSKKLKKAYKPDGEFSHYYETNQNTPYTGDIEYYNNYMYKQPDQPPKYNVSCIIADKRLPIIAVQNNSMYTQFNGKGIYLNTFLHRWATYGFSGFASYCVFFEKHKDAPIN